jgi:GNAT superfamily N-acetyltransferase
MPVRLAGHILGGETRVVVCVEDPEVQRDGVFDPDVVRRDAGNPPTPEEDRLLLAAVGAGHLMLRVRLAAGRARLLLLHHDGMPVAYCWLQDEGPYRRRLSITGGPWTVLGPLWTDPAHRGRGLFKRLLLHAIAERRAAEDPPLVAWIQESNTPSLRGFAAAGFRKVGTFAMRTGLAGSLVPMTPLS